MANSIYDYTGFYKDAIKPETQKNKTPQEMNKILYNADSVFWSSANRGKSSSTNVTNTSGLMVNKKLVDSTVYESTLSRFYNIDSIKFSKGKQFHDNTIGESNRENARQSQFTAVDAEWISSRFMTSSEHLSLMDANNRYFSTTGWKFDSTKLGHSSAINARPQFTRTCDIKGNNRFSTNEMGIYGASYGLGILEPQEGVNFGLGMGRYYSESIDDNATQIFLQFGVPKFNSLIDFFVNAVSYEDSYIANYGRIPLGYSIGSAVTGFIVWCAFPLITTTIWLLKTVVQFFFSHPLNYYYMEPTMHTYWTSVNLIVNQIAAELGLIAPALIEDQDPSTGQEKMMKMGTPVRISSADMRMLARYMPGAVSEKTGYIDIYHLATKGQALANELNKIEYKKYNQELDNKTDGVKQDLSAQGWYNKSGNVKNQSYYGKTNSGVWSKLLAALDNKIYLSDWLKPLLSDSLTDKDAQTVSKLSGIDNVKLPAIGEKTSMSFRGGAQDATASVTQQEKTDEEKEVDEKLNNFTIESKTSEVQNVQQAIDNSSLTDTDGFFQGMWSSVKNYFSQTATTFDSAVRDGGAYAIFNVDYQGSVSESFSNSVSDIQSSGLTKSIAQGARDIRFNLGGGLLATGVGQVVDAVKNFAMAGLEKVSFGLSNVVASILGGGYADLPKKWDDSDFSFPQLTYTMTLVSPYGNPISQMQNIYIPLAMILAGALPLQAGKSSYTSPFLCSVFNKGVQDVRLGMITSVNITRGVTNLPFSRTKRMLSCEVSFTVTDLSTRLVAPINSSPWKTLFSLNWDDDTPTGIYLATLASRDLFTNKYMASRTKLKIARLAMAFSQAVSPASAGFRAGQPSSTMNKIFGMFASEKRFAHTQRNY